jgi:hypothetical protein
VSTKSVATRPHHRASQLVQPSPCRLVATQPKDTFQTQSACSVLLAGYKPYCQKPCFQRDPRSLEYRTRRDRDIFATIPTMQVPSFRYPRLLEGSASWTLVPRWPAQRYKIFATGGLFLEKAVELVECTRVVDPADWPLRHAHEYIH